MDAILTLDVVTAKLIVMILILVLLIYVILIMDATMNLTPVNKIIMLVLLFTVANTKVVFLKTLTVMTMTFALLILVILKDLPIHLVNMNQ
jgi:hypothetical protein